MIPVTCLVQAGQVSSALEKNLRNDMAEFVKNSFDATAEIAWIVVPEKSGFTAGKPSTSILVSVQSNHALETAHRIELLHRLCNIWIEKTGLSNNEVVGVITDPKA